MLYHQRNILLVQIFLFFLRFTIAAAVSQRFTHGLQRSVGRTAHALRLTSSAILSAVDMFWGFTTFCWANGACTSSHILCHPHCNKLNFRLALPSPQETKLNPRRPGAAQENQVSTRNTCCLNIVSRGEGSSLGNGKLVYGCVDCCGHVFGPVPRCSCEAATAS